MENSMFNIQSWSNEFLKNATTPMDESMTGIFFNMMMLEMTPDQGKAKLNAPEITSSFMYQIIDRRAKHMELELSDPAKVFLMFLVKSPGSAVMYLSALRSKTKNVDMNVLANTFPIGFLSEQYLEIMWDKQKGHTDNYLDSCVFD